MRRLLRRIRLRLLKTGKHVLHTAGVIRVPRPHQVLVTGCQRSGTTMLLHAFQEDLRSRVFHEYNRVLFDASLRLRERGRVDSIFRRYARTIVVTKPLLDSQRLPELLESYPNAFAIWIYRHFAKVARSNLAMFGQENGRRDMRAIVEDDRSDWKVEGMTEATRKRIVSLYTSDATDLDAAALFWLARNSLYVDQKLFAHPRVILCNYERILEDPESALRRIYLRLGVRYPGNRVIRDIVPRPRHLEENLTLSEHVRAACDQLWLTLEARREGESA